MPSRRASPWCSVLTLCQEGLATVMFFLMFIYSWIFLKPFQPQLSSSLPAPMQSQALFCLCQGNRTRAAMQAMRGVEGASREPGTWPPAAACFPLARWGPGLPATPLQLVRRSGRWGQPQKRHQRRWQGASAPREALFLTKGLKHLGEPVSRPGSGFPPPCACLGAKSLLWGR